MQIIEYYNSGHRNIEGDKCISLAERDKLLTLEYRNLKNGLKQEYSVDFSGKNPEIAAPQSSKSFEKFKRVEAEREKNLAKILQIEKFCQKYTKICCVSEYEWLKSQLVSNQLLLNAELDSLEIRITKKHSQQVAGYVKRGREILGDGTLPPSSYLRVGIMDESRKIQNLQKTIDEFEKQIGGWRANEAEILAYIDKVCGVDQVGQRRT